MPRRLFFALAAVMLFAALPAPSHAGTCLAGRTCVYSGNGPSGIAVVLPDSHKVSNKLQRALNNEASAAVNNNTFAVFLYDRRDGKGDRFCIPPNSTLTNIDEFNDLASSSKTTRSTSCP